MPEVSVVMPAFNKETELNYVLSALSKQSLPINDYEVIVVNDGSTDNTAKIINGFTNSLNLRGFHLSRNPKGTSQAYQARNIGIKLAQAPVIVIIDSDIIPSSGFLQSHLGYHQQSSNIAVLGFTYAVSISEEVWSKKIPDYEMWDFNHRNELFAKGATQEFIKDKRHKRFGTVNDNIMELPIPWTYFWSHNLSIRKAKLLEVGLFDENFRRSGDFDLGYRLVKSGTELIFSRDAQAFHYPHPRDYVEDLKYDRMGEYYFLKKYPNIEVESLVAFGCYEASPTFPTIRQSIQHVITKSGFLHECACEYVNLPPRLVEGSSLIIGCGQGEIFKYISARGGVDINARNIQICKKRFSDKFFYELLGVALPFEDLAFSAVIVTDFWRFLPQILLEKLLLEAKRISKDVVLLETKNTNSSEQVIPSSLKFLESKNFEISQNCISSQLQLTRISSSD